MLMGITIVYLKVDRYHKISVVKIRDMNKVRNIDIESQKE